MKVSRSLGERYANLWGSCSISGGFCFQRGPEQPTDMQVESSDASSDRQTEAPETAPDHPAPEAAPDHPDHEAAPDRQAPETAPGPAVQRTYQKTWANTYPWLRMDEDKQVMFCQLCRDAGLRNTMAIGTNNFRTSTLVRHVETEDHRRIIAAPKEKANMAAVLGQARTKVECGIVIAMKAVHWLCKENLPIHKYPSLMKFLHELRVPDIEHLKCTDSVDYGSIKSANGFLDVLSSVIDSEITDRVNESPVITVLTDESTDIVVHHKLAINLRIVHPTTLKPSTHFLTDVHLEDSTGAGIFKAISQELKKRKIPVTKVCGLGTDGASVMMGRGKGLLGQFLRVNPSIASTHCSAHRVALVSEQAAEKVKAIKDFKDTVVSIYYHFKMSPTKVAALAEVQKVLDEPQLRYREVHQVRWLSFYSALETIQRTLDSLITYLANQDRDPKAKGVSKKIAQELFIKTLYNILDWLEPIMRLNLFFQQTNIDISLVKVNVESCIRDLTEMRDDVNRLGKPKYAALLDDVLKDGYYKGHKVTRNAHYFATVRREFVQGLIDGLHKRFPDTEMANRFGVLGMRGLSWVTDDDKLTEWGNEEVTALAEVYTSEATHEYEGQEYKSPPLISASVREIVREWERCKFLVKNLRYEQSSTAALWAVLAEYHREDFPNLIYLVYLALTHPIHTADVERCFSVQNLTTTALRNRMSGERCDQIMRVNIEGQDMKNFNFDAAIQKWRKMSSRKIFTVSK